MSRFINQLEADLWLPILPSNYKVQENTDLCQYGNNCIQPDFRFCEECRRTLQEQAKEEKIWKKIANNY